MNLNQLELLRVLQETDFNLSKAAEKMHVVQSAVSRQLQLFEIEVGSPLFVRQGKKLTGLTPLGEKIMEEVDLINQAKKNIQLIADDFLENSNGTLRIATTHTQAKYLLPEPIGRFRRKYPGIKIYMVQSSPDNLINLLHRHQADIAICTEKLDEDDKLVVKPCYHWHHVAVVPAGHPLAEGEISLQRLSAQPILTYTPGFTGRTTIEKAFYNANLPLDITLAAADSDVIKTYVRLGMGVGIIAGTAYEASKDSDLVARDLSGLIPSSTTKIAYLKQLYVPNYCRYFIDELLAEAARKSRERGEDLDSQP
ncbi:MULTISPECIES: LysR substrate-binding domain-containing protein [Methylomonas]|uniref:LysR family transcriptional regulator n=2 Tax=Methylomonas TaxID=416 RepID=A0A140E442_9GAMM|nr:MULTISPECIES: LysR substrate-binding domain-containing protein [Methylomonas]AMK75166.1 LysR family transcriptional regulator [Methylomonas denitrificans]OAH99435.1 LysR family transcriptional regulator [Methylomonas methanica]TCV85087.1 LysR family cys regulon transcriptional activator/LysR family cys regulon transcriptional activator [Methylomonas methanica]